MQALADWPNAQRRNIIGVFTDIDDTLTTHGEITADAFQAVSALKTAGLHVIAITGRPVGWATPLALRLPVDAIVVENGAAALQRLQVPKAAEINDKNELEAAYLLPKQLLKLYQQDVQTRIQNQARMQSVAQHVRAQLPHVRLSRDSVGRETDLAFDYNEYEQLSPATVQQVVQLLQEQGMLTTISSIHIHGTYERFDKWRGASWIVQHLFGRDLSLETDQWAFVGDSGNDEVMFQRFKNSVGVANIMRFAPQLRHLPSYITPGQRGAGFAQVAQAILSAKKC